MSDQALEVPLNGYVLVQAEVGMAKGVGQALREVEGVTDVDMVTGPYDVIARTESESFDDLGSLMDRIHKVDGVARTLTCSVVHL